MAIGQRLDDDELSDTSLYELYSVLGSNDTPRLFELPYNVDTEHDIPFGAGNSIDRKTIYIDRDLYAEVMDGECAATGLTPEQLIERFLDHEHCEKSIVDGDNPVDTYYGGHARALRREHEGVIAILGRDDAEAKIKNYEKVIWPGLQRAYAKPIERVPRDLWCGPLRDVEADEHDDELLKQMLKLGVADAGKRSKYETHYGLTGPPCRECRNYKPSMHSEEAGALAACAIVGGLVRHDRSCDYFMRGQEEFHPRMVGAKQAEDGEWYVPDVQRPGKYLRVER